MAVLRLIVSSLQRQKPLYILWVLSLAAAVSGLIVVDVFRQSLTGTLQTQGRKILTADASLSARRMLTEDEVRGLSEVFTGSTAARMTEMFAMVSGNGESRLALVRFVSDEYPLVGELKLEATGQQVHGSDLADAPLAWAAGDLFTLLNLKPGAKVKIGNLEFKLADSFSKDSSQTFRMGNMAPRLYVHRKFLNQTGLVQYGSTLTDAVYAAAVQTPPGLKKALEEKFKDASLQITVPADLEQGSLRMLSRLLDYLGLTGLVTLSLGWIGVYYLGRRWLAMEAKSAGVLKCLGVSSRELRRLLLTKLTVILSGGVLLGGFLAWFAAHALLPFVRDSLPADFELLWSWKNTLLLLAVGPMAGLLLLNQAIRQLAFEKPLDLFQERVQAAKVDVRGLILLLVSVAALFLLLTFMQARSWRVTGTFISALSASVILVAAIGFGFLKGVQKLRKPSWNWRTHLFTAQWTRRTGTSLLLITVSALAGLLSQLLPHLEKTLVGELNSPQGIERPALFMVDIQDEQLEPLKSFLTANGIEVGNYSPFVRARILSVNNSEFERGETGEFSTREEENDARFRNRGVNLSYRKELSDSESIISGKDWKDLSIDPPEIAVEQGYADRLKLKIDDVVRFDVQGIEIAAKIAAIRKINWESFNPNFFIQFPDGVLNEAPKTWIMAVKKHPTLTPPKMQTMITKNFSNVTSINVSEALDSATELIGQLSSGLKMASRLSLALGVFVFLMILLFQLVSARRDWRQLLVLGLTARQVWWLQILNYGLLCLLGTAIGALLSLAVAWGLFRFAFDSRTDFDFMGMAQVWLITWAAVIGGLAWLGWRETRQARGGLSSESFRD